MLASNLVAIDDTSHNGAVHPMRHTGSDDDLRVDDRSAFRLRGLTRTFAGRSGAVYALRGVDLDVPQGSFTVVVGPSGCGKTTLLRILAGFERPDSGDVWLGERHLAGSGVFVRPERRRVGIVTQEGSLFPHLSVAANIAYGLADSRWTRNGRQRRHERVEELLELVGLAGYGSRLPSELSGGEQQRIALARALAPRPDAVLLDEPFSALDARLRIGLREEVRDLLARLGTTTVLVTHDQNEALSLADRVAVMRAGRVVQEGPPAEVYAAPIDLESAAFLGETVEINCRLLNEDDDCCCVDSILGTLQVRTTAVHPHAQGNVLLLRPEQLEIGTTGTDARVVGVQFFGHQALVRLQLDDHTPVLVRLQGDCVPSVGALVRVRLREGRGFDATQAPSAARHPEPSPLSHLVHSLTGV